MRSGQWKGEGGEKEVKTKAAAVEEFCICEGVKKRDPKKLGLKDTMAS